MRQKEKPPGTLPGGFLVIDRPYCDMNWKDQLALVTAAGPPEGVIWTVTFSPAERVFVETSGVQSVAFPVIVQVSMAVVGAEFLRTVNVQVAGLTGALFTLARRFLTPPEADADTGTQWGGRGDPITHGPPGGE